MDEPAFGRASVTRKRQRPLHTMALFASLRQSARMRASASASAAPAAPAAVKATGKRVEMEGLKPRRSSSPPQPPSAPVAAASQARTRHTLPPSPPPPLPPPPGDHHNTLGGLSLPPATCASLPLASQLPTFSMEGGESPMECGLLQLTGATQPRPARGQQPHAPAPPPGGRWQEQQQRQQETTRPGPVTRSSSSQRVATDRVFSGAGVLPGVRARLGQEAARLREQGLSGTYRGVMQEMALATVLRGELEYVVPAGPLRRGSKPQAADTQLEYAFEALGRAVLAPAGLPSGARVLGLADDVMASIGLAVQEEAAETNWVS